MAKATHDITVYGQGAGEAARPYARQAGEPDREYALFQIYLGLGAERSLRKVSVIYYGHNVVATRQCSGIVSRASMDWDWVQRAQAYDLDQAEQTLAIEENERLRARLHRREIIDEMLDSVVAVLRKADMHTLGKYEARAWLPIMRLMLKDLLASQRIEYEEVAHPDETDQGFDTFQPEHYANAMQQLALWSQTLDGQEGDEDSYKTLDLVPSHVHD